MFFSNALFAISAPTSFAASLFAYLVLTSLSNVEAETNVFPATSSIICTYNTFRWIYRGSFKKNQCNMDCECTMELGNHA